MIKLREKRDRQIDIFIGSQGINLERASPQEDHGNNG
jgi:hypothetical protein